MAYGVDSLPSDSFPEPLDSEHRDHLELQAEKHNDDCFYSDSNHIDVFIDQLEKERLGWKTLAQLYHDKIHALIDPQVVDCPGEAPPIVVYPNREGTQFRSSVDEE